MKRAGFDHPKLTRLARLLGIQRAVAIGICESLWQFTAKFAPAGDVGKWADEEIFEAVDAPVDGGAMLDALCEVGLLDRTPDRSRMVVHDWADHCEDSIHAMLARRRDLFAGGQVPRLTKLPKGERADAERDYKAIQAASGGLKPPKTADGGLKPPARPSPAKPGHARPEPAPKPRPTATSPRARSRSAPGPARKQAGVFKNLTEEVLRSDAKLKAWYDDATTRRKPVLQACEANLLRVFGAAERALAKGNNPVALFAAIVSKRSWNLIDQNQERQAADRLKALQHAADSPGHRLPQPNGDDEMQQRRDEQLAGLRAATRDNGSANQPRHAKASANGR